MVLRNPEAVTIITCWKGEKTATELFAHLRRSIEIRIFRKLEISRGRTGQVLVTEHVATGCRI